MARCTEDAVAAAARAAALGALAVLAACGSGGGPTGNDGGGNGDGGSGTNGGGTVRRGLDGNPLGVQSQFVVESRHASARFETLRASVPFPKGLVRSLERIGVKGMKTAWMPLQFWPDGSIRVAQAQLTDTFAPEDVRTYTVVKDVQTLQGPFVRNSWVEAAKSLTISARVVDTKGVSYEAAASEPTTVQETFLVRVQHCRVYHRARTGTGIGRDYLTSQFYVTEFREQPYLIVDWILGNDYLGTDQPAGATDPNLFPLGSIDVRSAHFQVKGAAEVRPYLAAEHAISAAVQSAAGTSFQVMQDTFLDDGQTRRYRFFVRIDDAEAPELVRTFWRDAFVPFAEDPVLPLADVWTWKASSALGLTGGPLLGPTDSRARAEAAYQAWRGKTANFGTWGSFGDVKESGTTGTPRNHPVEPDLAHAIQGMHSRLLVALEQKAWAQAMRPYHMYGLSVGADQDICLWEGVPFWPGSRGISADSLGRRALWANDPYAAYRTMVDLQHRGHGWDWYDLEHWSSDLLFDYWSVTGDAWAKDELRLVGECLKGTARLQKYYTATIMAARAEGWMMQSFVQVWLATRDQALKDFALRRAHEIVDAQRRKDHPSKTIQIMGHYTGTGFPADTSFYMPWQHGAVLYGYLGAWRFFEDPVCLQIAEDVVSAVEYAWVTNYQDPRFGLVANGLRYYVPVSLNGAPIPPGQFDATIGPKWGDSPLGGAHGFLIGGLYLLSQASNDPTVRTKARHYGSLLLGDINGYPDARWYTWNLVVPDDLL